MTEYHTDRVGGSAHVGNNDAGNDIININNNNIDIRLPTSQRLDDYSERFESYLPSNLTRGTNSSQSPLLQSDETTAPPLYRDQWENIQRLLKRLISACQQWDNKDNQDSRHPLRRFRENLDSLEKHFGELVAPNQFEFAPGQVSPIQVTSTLAAPNPETPGSATPNPTTPTPATTRQTNDRRTSVESRCADLSKVNHSSAQSLEKDLSEFLAEFLAFKSSEPLKDALSRFTFSHNGVDSSMQSKKRSPTFSMETLFRITPGQKVETLHLDRTSTHLESDDPIQISIVGEKAKNAVSEWVKKAFDKRKQKWDGDCYTDIRITSLYGTSEWDVTFRLHVPKKLKRSKELENLDLDVAVFFFDKADIKTLEKIAQHYKTRRQWRRVLLGLDGANELTKLETHRPNGRKFDVEPVSKADVEKALEDSKAALCIECAGSHDDALMKLFSVLFCFALSARQASRRRNSSR